MDEIETKLAIDFLEIAVESINSGGDEIAVEFINDAATELDEEKRELLDEAVSLLESGESDAAASNVNGVMQDCMDDLE